MREREPQHELPARGDLLCLYHPDTSNIFSGYGLVVRPGWPGYMVGLLMVDRPFPAPDSWLQNIRNTYGECELLPMTAGGERGLLCQMQVEEDSLPHLRYFAGLPGQRESFQEALEPLLERPPTPVLALRWNEERRAWLSELVLRNELPLAVREVFERSGYGCLAVESSCGIIHVCHAADDDIDNFINKPVKARWDMIEMPTAPLVRLELLVYDDPHDPFCFESFLNVAAPDQLAVLIELAGQAELYMAFYGDDLTYRTTAVVPHGEQQWQRLDEIISQAAAYWAGLPEEVRDFDRAKALYMRIHP